MKQLLSNIFITIINLNLWMYNYKRFYIMIIISIISMVFYFTHYVLSSKNIVELRSFLFTIIIEIINIILGSISILLLFLLYHANLQVNSLNNILKLRKILVKDNYNNLKILI